MSSDQPPTSTINPDLNPALNPYQGWYKTHRFLAPYSGPEITPGEITPDTLKLVFVRSSMAFPSEFGSAFLDLNEEKKILLDAKGELWSFIAEQPQDDSSPPSSPKEDTFTYITQALSTAVLSQVPPGFHTFPPSETRSQPTCQPIHIFHIPSSESGYATVSMYSFGFSKEFPQPPTQTVDDMDDSQPPPPTPPEDEHVYATYPPALQEIFELASETLDGDVDGPRENQALVDAVMNLVNPKMI